MSRFSIVLSSTVILAVTGCVSLPNGPDVVVLPGTGLSFEQFRNDDIVCQQFATYQIGGTTANQAAVNSGVTSAAVGTALGAAAGAAIGGGRGAAIGAGSGLVGGSLVGAGTASSSMYGTQQRYDPALYSMYVCQRPSGSCVGTIFRFSAPSICAASPAYSAATTTRFDTVYTNSAATVRLATGSSTITES